GPPAAAPRTGSARRWGRRAGPPHEAVRAGGSRRWRPTRRGAFLKLQHVAEQLPGVRLSSRRRTPEGRAGPVGLDVLGGGCRGRLSPPQESPVGDDQEKYGTKAGWACVQPSRRYGHSSFGLVVY